MKVMKRSTSVACWAVVVAVLLLGLFSSCTAIESHRKEHNHEVVCPQ